MVDGIMRPPIIGPRRHRQHAVSDCNAGVRLNDVDVVGRDLDTMGGINDGHRGVWLQQFVQAPFVLGIEVLDDHQREPWSRRQSGDEMRKRTEAPGKGADTDDRKWIMGGGLSHLGEYRCQATLWAGFSCR